MNFDIHILLHIESEQKMIQIFFFLHRSVLYDSGGITPHREGINTLRIYQY